MSIISIICFVLGVVSALILLVVPSGLYLEVDSSMSLILGFSLLVGFLAHKGVSLVVRGFGIVIGGTLISLSFYDVVTLLLSQPVG
jgi:hypothetical protein